MWRKAFTFFSLEISKQQIRLTNKKPFAPFIIQISRKKCIKIIIAQVCEPQWNVSCFISSSIITSKTHAKNRQFTEITSKFSHTYLFWRKLPLISFQNWVVSKTYTECNQIFPRLMMAKAIKSTMLYETTDVKWSNPCFFSIYQSFWIQKNHLYQKCSSKPIKEIFRRKDKHCNNSHFSMLKSLPLDIKIGEKQLLLRILFYWTNLGSQQA